MLLLIIPLLMISTPVGAEPSFIYCYNTTFNYSPNSPFETSLKGLLDSLLSNTALNAGYYESSIGNDSNQVFGQALCRGDVTPEACKNCVENASQEIMKKCQREEAIIWHELCQIHYSYRTFFSSMVYTGKYPDSNEEEKNVTDPVNFQVALMDLMNNLSNKAACDSSMFATGKIKFLETETIYGLVQCTRDMSGGDCRNCFNFALTELNECCSSRQGGTIFSRNCNARFEMYPFYQDSTNKGDRWKIWVVVAVSCVFVVAALICCYKFNRQQRREAETDEDKSQNVLLHNLASSISLVVTEESNLVSSRELPFMEFEIVKAATDNFLDSNKLGRGGFGTVYKGVLSNGDHIAVKRLSRKSWQGLEEFKNEIVLLAKLQHRNLVRLLGCSTKGDEKLLIYEYMPNKSLDAFIFDLEQRSRLNWDARRNIVNGIARGLLYLHEESRLKIIHRDLKPNNVLLDNDMVAKISDFGMARIFCEDQNTANTRRVVGTYGYLAPEYAMDGLFSVKSDVFSFGVILLEIISGKRNTRFYLTEHAQTLLAYAWRLWNEGQELEFVDPLLTESCPAAEVVRCIHIGLLCVQEDPEERPTMSSVVVMLGSESMQFPQPSQSAFSVGRKFHHIDQSLKTTDHASLNEVTVSSISPR